MPAPAASAATRTAPRSCRREAGADRTAADRGDSATLSLSLRSLLSELGERFGEPGALHLEIARMRVGREQSSHDVVGVGRHDLQIGRRLELTRWSRRATSGPDLGESVVVQRMRFRADQRRACRPRCPMR